MTEPLLSPTALPTPFDITVPPYFPYVPSLRDWVVVVGVAIAVAAIGYVLQMRRRSVGVAERLAMRALGTARSSLDPNSLTSDDRAALARVVQLFRRAIGIRIGVPGEALTTAELPASHELHDLRAALVAVEAIAYGAPVHESAAELLRQLQQHGERYFSKRRDRGIL